MTGSEEDLAHYLSESKRLDQLNREGGKSKKIGRSLNAGESELETNRHWHFFNDIP